MGQNLSKNKSYDVAAAKADDTEGEGQIKPVVSNVFAVFISFYS